MSINSSKEAITRGHDEDRSSQEETANENRQAGPNSSREGQPIAPQMGDPRAKDRRPN